MPHFFSPASVQNHHDYANEVHADGENQANGLASVAPTVTSTRRQGTTTTVQITPEAMSPVDATFVQQQTRSGSVMAQRLWAHANQSVREQNGLLIQSDENLSFPGTHWLVELLGDRPVASLADAHNRIDNIGITRLQLSDLIEIEREERHGTSALSLLVNRNDPHGYLDHALFERALPLDGPLDSTTPRSNLFSGSARNQFDFVAAAFDSADDGSALTGNLSALLQGTYAQPPSSLSLYATAGVTGVGDINAFPLASENNVQAVNLHDVMRTILRGGELTSAEVDLVVEYDFNSWRAAVEAAGGVEESAELAPSIRLAGRPIVSMTQLQYAAETGYFVESERQQRILSFNEQAQAARYLDSSMRMWAELGRH